MAYSRLIDACHKRHAAAEQMHDAACERAKESGEEQPPMPTEASWEWHTTEVKRIDAEHEALLTTAQAAVEAAEAEANVSKAATDDALGALGVAESAVTREVARLEAMRARAIEEAFDAQDKIIAALTAENELLSERLRMVTPFLPQLRVMEQYEMRSTQKPRSGATSRDGASWCGRQRRRTRRIRGMKKRQRVHRPRC